MNSSGNLKWQKTGKHSYSSSARGGFWLISKIDGAWCVSFVDAAVKGDWIPCVSLKAAKSAAF
jgi:hypothetical protein